MSVSVCQINIASEPNHTFFLKLEWANDLGAGFVLVLCDGVSAWGGEVSEEDVTREAYELEMEREKYVQDLWLALGGEGRKGDYTFHLSSNSTSGGPLHLSYEKVQKSISIRLGLVELQQIHESADVIKDLIIHGLEGSAKLLASNREFKEENQMLKQEQKHITSELERYVQGKKLLERDLYTRFVLVLNAKKAKIKSQQEEIKKLQEKLEELREAAQGKKKAPHQSSESARISPPVEDTYSASTDEEWEENPLQSLAPKQPIYGAEGAGHSSFEDSLSDIIDVAPSRRHRHRHLQGTSVQAKKVCQVQNKRKEPGEYKAKTESNLEAVQQPAAKTTDQLETDNLFDDF